MIMATNEAELAEILRTAETPLSIRGGGTRLAEPARGEVLSVAGLSGITLYEPGALTLVAQAGTPLAEIETALAAEGQRLAFEPPDLRGLLGTQGVPTIGGVFATNASGPRRVAAGAARDFLLGVRFVDGTGRVVKNGGRVMKNVTGYDLVKLMAGSWGTLGVLTEVSLKVLPKPELTGLLTLDGLGPAEAVAVMSAALGSPWEVTGAMHGGPAGLTRLRIEGLEASVRYRLDRLKELLSRYGEVATAVGETADLPWLDDLGQLAAEGQDIWRLNLPPSAAPGVVARLPEGAQALLDWGGGLIWAVVSPGTDLRQHLGTIPGHATRLRGTGGGIARFQPQPEPVARLSTALKAQFDPRGLLNPGLMEG